MATNSGRGNPVGSASNPPTPDLHPPPVSDEFKQDIAATEASEPTGGRAAGHDPASSLPAKSVVTGEQVEKDLSTVAETGGK